ncbi:MAG TPA: SH3-like domain-containing protein [Actinomycetota bacterium]|nr:SH3-like domain-containing protein [Actinomycetota bacterium]
MDGVHDMGGMQGFGDVVRPDSDGAIRSWELRVFALNMLSGIQGLEGGPGFRARIESMPAERYLEASYYERWLWRVEQDLLAGGTIAPGEVEDMMERLRAGEAAPTSSDPELVTRTVDELRKPYPLAAATSPRFAAGDRVRVRRMRPATHNRCPRYVRGASGVVHAVQGEDRLPGAPGGGPREAVYSVAFPSAGLWGPSGGGTWTVLIDLWESYMEPEEGGDG